MAAIDPFHDEFSDDKIYDNIGEFGLIELNEYERWQIQGILDDFSANPDADTSDIDLLQDYVTPAEFVWQMNFVFIV